MTQFTCKGVKQINNRISLNMIFTFTIRISRRFSSARKFQMGNFQKYWSQNVGQDFFVLDFFHGRKILKVDGRDGRDLKNREKNAPAGRFTWHVWIYDILHSEIKFRAQCGFERFFSHTCYVTKIFCCILPMLAYSCILFKHFLNHRCKLHI